MKTVALAVLPAKPKTANAVSPANPENLFILGNPPTRDFKSKLRVKLNSRGVNGLFAPSSSLYSATNLGQRTAEESSFGTGYLIS
jgi:hypothetical protein